MPFWQASLLFAAVTGAERLLPVRALLGLPTATAATVLINVLGSAAIGYAAGCVEREGLRLLLMTGLLGGFTTFSAFGLQTWTLLQEGRPLPAALNAALSLLLCVVAAGAGLALAARSAP